MKIKKGILLKSLVFSVALLTSYATNPAAFTKQDPKIFNAHIVEASSLETDVYRFYSSVYKSHFYTVSEQEKDFIIASDTNWNYEGIAYSSFTESQESTTPLHRFYSDLYRSHFYTKSTEEKDFIIENNANWKYEGIAYHVQSVGAPIYRFYSPSFQSHFYTTSLQERDHLIENDPNWLYEGIAFYATQESADATDPITDTTDNATDDSACGSDHGQTLSAPPSQPLCQNELSAADQTGSGPWLWTCRDAGGVLVSTCRAELEGAREDVQGQCGSAVNTCAVGDFIDTQDSDEQHLWGCIGSGSFSTFAECSLDK